MLIHTKERNFSCEICGKTFSRLEPRDIHRLIHTQNREHKCEYCGKLFLLKHQLKNHIGIHTGERFYTCGLCPLTFINSSGVSVHRRTHKEGNEYRCQLCNFKIKELRFLKVHFLEHKPMIKNDLRALTNPDNQVSVVQMFINSIMQMHILYLTLKEFSFDLFFLFLHIYRFLNYLRHLI